MLRLEPLSAMLDLYNMILFKELPIIFCSNTFKGSQHDKWVENCPKTGFSGVWIERSILRYAFNKLMYVLKFWMKSVSGMQFVSSVYIKAYVLNRVLGVRIGAYLTLPSLVVVVIVVVVSNNSFFPRIVAKHYYNIGKEFTTFGWRINYK